MAIYDILCSTMDQREANGICAFNGYLEDYLNVLEKDEANKELLTLFQTIWERDHDLRICVDLRLNINKDAIANQIIRYKDSFKLPHGTIRCPYLLYGRYQDAQKAMIVTLGDQQAYVLAKALYYVMSEPENEYEGCRNEIIACHIDPTQPQLFYDTMERFFHHHAKAGIIQRHLDSVLFLNYEEMYEIAQSMASYQLVNLKEILAQSADKESTINGIIATWFLLKKFSYVQYMMDKNNLNLHHAGNVKKQRQAAKEKCDAIGFVSYSELWKLVKDLK